MWQADHCSPYLLITSTPPPPHPLPHTHFVGQSSFNEIITILEDSKKKVKCCRLVLLTVCGLPYVFSSQWQLTMVYFYSSGIHNEADNLILACSVIQPLQYNGPCMSVSNVQKEAPVSVKNKQSFFSRFCFNLQDKTSVVLVSWHRLRLSLRVSDLRVSRISWNKVRPRFPPSLPPVHRLLGCGEVSARLLRDQFISRSGPPAEVPNYL